MVNSVSSSLKIEANWINNSKVYAVKMNGQTVGREGARNLGEVRTGVEAKVNNNLSLWGMSVCN